MLELLTKFSNIYSFFKAIKLIILKKLLKISILYKYYAPNFYIIYIFLISNIYVSFSN